MFLSMESHDTWKFSSRVSDNAVGYEFSVNESTILVMEEGGHPRGKEKGEEENNIKDIGKSHKELCYFICIQNDTLYMCAYKLHMYQIPMNVYIHR